MIAWSLSLNANQVLMLRWLNATEKQERRDTTELGLHSYVGTLNTLIRKGLVRQVGKCQQLTARGQLVVALIDADIAAVSAERRRRR